MKVLLINGSANVRGCTYTALAEVGKALNNEGIETEIISLGKSKRAPGIGTPSFNTNWYNLVMYFE